MAYDDERESWTEKAMVDRVKIELQNEGYVVSVEHRLRFRRRVDMVVFHNAPKVTFRRGRLITGDGRGDIVDHHDFRAGVGMGASPFETYSSAAEWASDGNVPLQVVE